MAAGSTYTPIATTTLGSASATVTFSSIPSTYTDLVLVCNFFTAASVDIYMRFNSDTGTNYSQTNITGTYANTAVSNRYSNLSLIYFDFNASINNASNPTIAIANIQNYSNTTTYKTALLRVNDYQATTAEVGAAATLWRSTAAINSLSVSSTAGANLATGSTFTLYGITNA